MAGHERDAPADDGNECADIQERDEPVMVLARRA
jgi:hypothetical protein